MLLRSHAAQNVAKHTKHALMHRDDGALATLAQKKHTDKSCEHQLTQRILHAVAQERRAEAFRQNTHTQ